MPKINPIARALRSQALHQRRVKPKRGRGAYRRKERTNEAHHLRPLNPPRAVGRDPP